MNGLEVLYDLLFVQVDKGLWGIIIFGVVVAAISFIFDFDWKGKQPPEHWL